MPRIAEVKTLRLERVSATLTTLVSALAIYLGVLYVFAFSQASSSARNTVHLGILLMDAVLVGAVVRDHLARRSGAARNRSVLRYLAYAVLAGVVALQADYLLARSRGAEEGVLGSLSTAKSWLLALQLLSVLLLARARAAGMRSLTAALKLDRRDFLLFSIVLIPLANYLAHNITLFSWMSAAGFLAFFLLCPLAAVVVVRLVEVNGPPIAVPMVAGLTFVYYSLPLVSAILARPVEALLQVNVGLAAAVGIGVTALYSLDRRTTSTALAVVAACSVVASGARAAFIGGVGSRSPSVTPYGEAPGERSALESILAQTLLRRPDVYLLVYDGYAPSALMDYYGIDDRDTDEFLKHSGFTIYDEAYSLFLSSRPSMASVMDMRANPRAGIGGPATATRFFRQHGYATHLVLNSYLLQGSEPIEAEFVFPPAQARSPLAMLYRGIAGGEFKTEIVFQDSPRDVWLAAKRSVLEEKAGPPRMMYAHSGFPGHSQNSGECLPDETAAYARRLDVARAEIRDDVEVILRGGRDAIVIVAGDHGPFLTGDCLYMARHGEHALTGVHLADRYGAKLAIRWGDSGPSRFGRIAVVQDAFLAVAAVLLADGRVLDHRPAIESVGYGGIPDGAIRDGVVTIGTDKGKRLFETIAAEPSRTRERGPG